MTNANVAVSAATATVVWGFLYGACAVLYALPLILTYFNGIPMANNGAHVLMELIAGAFGLTLFLVFVLLVTGPRQTLLKMLYRLVGRHYVVSPGRTMSSFTKSAPGATRKPNGLPEGQMSGHTGIIATSK